MTNAAAEFNRLAGERAAGLVVSGMAIGLGTGSTAIFATRWSVERARRGNVYGIVAVATSYVTFARALGIPMLADDGSQGTDLTIGGADEVDPAMNLIKGGALLLERIVRQAPTREAFVLDESTLPRRLAAYHSLSAAVLTFDYGSWARFLRGLGAVVTPRRQDVGPYRTDRFDSCNGPRCLLSASRITAGNNNEASCSLAAR